MPGQLKHRDRNAVEAFLARVRAEVGPLREPAVVFGSAVRGEATAESDVDILLVLDREDEDVRRKVFDLAFEVFLESDVLVSPLVMSPKRVADWRRAGRRLIRDVQQDGVVV